MTATSDRWGGAARRLCWSLAVLLSIAAGLLPGPALATLSKLAPDRRGLIHTCYGPSDRDELHVIAVNKPCRRGEQRLSWSQRGSSPPIDSDDPAVVNWYWNSSTGTSTTTNTTITSTTTTNTSDTTTKTTTNKTTITNTPTFKPTGGTSVWSWIGDAAPHAGELLALGSLGVLALSLILVPAVRAPLRLARVSSRVWSLPIVRPFGPALQIERFDDKALRSGLGTVFALMTQARVGGEREGAEGGMHLYLVTGEESPGSAIAQLHDVPQTQVLGVALSLLSLTLWRPRLVVSGSLTPANDREAVAVALALRRDSKFIDSAELWPIERRTNKMPSRTSNRVLAVAAAGWIEHIVADLTPGPPAREVFLSHDPRSWAFFRAGAELSRISYLEEGADYYERALAIDGRNIGALVDLAHIRRLGDHFDGAVALAYSAIDEIERRHAESRGGEHQDPVGTQRLRWTSIWYRAQIVLATVHAEWAKRCEASGEQDKAEHRRRKAYDCAVSVASIAMRTRSWLEERVGEDELRKVAEGVKMRRWAQRRRLPQVKRDGWKFDPIRAAELHQLLGTTFEPGALLLVATTGPNRHEPPPTATDREIRYSDANGQREPLKDRVARARREARAQFETGAPPHPEPLIRYLRTLPRKSPRVIYNLACYYSLAAVDHPALKPACIEISAEYLRQSISRSPPRERRGLWERAESDRDLAALREAREGLLSGLEGELPRDPEDTEDPAGV